MSSPKPSLALHGNNVTSVCFRVSIHYSKFCPLASSRTVQVVLLVLELVPPLASGLFCSPKDTKMSEALTRQFRLADGHQPVSSLQKGAWIRAPTINSRPQMSQLPSMQRRSSVAFFIGRVQKWRINSSTICEHTRTFLGI